MNVLLPREWWKLSLVWLLNLKSRTPPARKSLLTNSLRTSVLGLALSVAAVSVSLALFTGFEETLATSVAGSLGHLTHFSRWHTQAELDSFVRHAPPGVQQAVYFWTSQGLLVGPQGGRGVLIEGRTQHAGKAAESADGPVWIDLGKPLAEQLGVKPGDPVRVLLPGILKAPFEARVNRLLQYGMYDLDSRLAIVHDESLRGWLARHDPAALEKRPGDAHGIRFTLSTRGHDPGDIAWVDAWTHAYRASLEAQGSDERSAMFRSWQELQHNLFGSIGLDKQVVVTVMGLLTLVATLNVAATLVVLFLERDRELAILRAVGLSAAGLRSWISLQGFLIGVLASALGLALGRAFGGVVQRLPFARLPADIYHIDHLPLRFSWGEQLVTFGFGVAASTLVAWGLGTSLARTNLLSVLGQRR